MSEAAGWHPDPSGRHEHRFWDGAQWTEHVSDGGEVAIDAYEPEGGTTAVTHPIVLEPFDSDDSYVQKLFAHEMFGVAPGRSAELLASMKTADPEERLIASMRVRHGLAEGGYLILTTHWLRYVKQGMVFTAVANDEFWPLDGALALEAPMGGRPLFVTPDGHQFQVFPSVPILSRKQAQSFHGIYRLASFANFSLASKEQEAALQGMAAAGSASVAAEIKELVALRDSGALSDAEFEAAKSRTLQP
jgi:hypothetical protein